MGDKPGWTITEPECVILRKRELRLREAQVLGLAVRKVCFKNNTGHLAASANRSYDSFKKKCLLFLREREREQGAEEGGDRGSEAGSLLTAESPMQGSNSRTMTG